MTAITIPDWSNQGFLPPADPSNPTSPQRSPYAVALLDVVMRFSTTPEQRQILSGLMAYRTALHNMGLGS